MTSDDSTLLREYAQSNSEQAFATLVSQHVNLVYSVALRQVREPHLAEEITQAVFIVLARKAKTLSPKTILSGWLCRTARNVSANTLKVQRRRQFREREAHMQSSFDVPEPDAWLEIAPMLDEALGCLGEKEHDAVVLRFFEGKELRQVGAAMGTTEDAARMRVNRGIEKLRAFFTRRGVVLSATAIAGAVGGNSIQAAPVGLAASITAAAFCGTTITTTAVIAAAKTITMTTLQKTTVVAIVVVLTGAGIYEARQASNARAEVRALQQRQSPLTEQISQLQRERDDTLRQLASLREDNERLNRDTRELLRLRGEIGQLRNAVRTKAELNPTNAPPAELQDLLSNVAARIQTVALAAIMERYPNLDSSELAFDGVRIATRPDGSQMINVGYFLHRSVGQQKDFPEKGKTTFSAKAINVTMSLAGQVQNVSEGARETTYNLGE